MRKTQTKPVQVSRLRADDEQMWRALWAGYIAFYRTEIGEAVTSHTWSLLADPSSSMIGLGARVDAELVGFATVVVHARTWTVEATAYLEDLFVHSDARNRGIGGTLIQAVIDAARARGCGSVYWHTQATNSAARSLYDRFTSADDVVRYRLALGRGRG